MAGLLEPAGPALTRFLSAGEVRKLLADHGLAAHKRRGQNFVVDANTVRSIVRRAEVRPGELVVEIGPGLGALTVALAEAGAQVLAVELDAGLARLLPQLLAKADVRNVEVVHDDALAVSWESMVGGRQAALVANLPYNVATPLVMHALECGCFTRMHVMVQREVGERWAANVGDPSYGAVSVKIAAMADVSLEQRISRRVFYPVPNVDSVVVRLVPRSRELGVARAALGELVDAGFRQRRKRLRNALVVAGCSAVDVEAALEAVALPPGARAEELDLASWAALARELLGPQ